MTTSTVSIFSKAHLASLKASALVTHYNDVATFIKAKTVKKFTDKPTALKRCLKIQDQHAEWLNKELAVNPKAFKTVGALIKVDAPAEIPVKIKKEKKAKKVQKSKRQSKGAIAYSADDSGKPAKSIKTLVLELFEQNVEDADIVSTIQDIYPESKFNQDHVSWYRSTMFRDGIVGADQAPRRSKAYKAWLAEQK